MLLQRYEERGEAFLSIIVTGDRTWVFHYTPESKGESMTWKHRHKLIYRYDKCLKKLGDYVEK